MKNIIFLTLSLVSTLLWSSPKAEAVGIGPFNVTKSFCQNTQKLQPILQVYSTVVWPVTGVPGITTGLLQNTSVVLDFCNFLMQVEQLNTQDAIFYSANYLNELTGKKWDAHLKQADRTWNLANSVYDFENKGMRQGALRSASTHREIVDFSKESFSWYNKTFNGSDARLQTRGEREQEMNQLAGVAYRRAILKEALNCPAGYGNKDYDKAYKNEIQPQEKLRDDTADDIQFFRSKLMNMGPRFMNNNAELQEFIKGVEDIMVQSASYQVAVKKKQESTTKPGPIDKKTGMPSQVKSNITKDTQVWTVRMFADVTEKFKKRWSSNWSSYVTSQYLQKTEGLLDNPAERVEANFKDLNYECNVSRLMRGVDYDRADYQKIRDERVQTCQDQVRMNQKKAENLLNYYANQLQQVVYQNKMANANIWTKESFYLGAMRAVNQNNTTEGYQQEQVSCSDQLQPAEMQKLTLKQQAVENEYSEITAKQVMKQTSMMEMEARANAQQAKEAADRKSFAENQSKKSADAIKTGIVPVSTKGGI